MENVRNGKNDKKSFTGRIDPSCHMFMFVSCNRIIKSNNLGVEQIGGWLVTDSAV